MIFGEVADDFKVLANEVGFDRLGPVRRIVQIYATTLPADLAIEKGDDTGETLDSPSTKSRRS
jgi:hypothetical protein